MTRPGIRAATFASRFGSAARLPVTIKSSEIEARLTFVTVTSGTAALPFSSSAAPFPQDMRRIAKHSTANVLEICLVKRRSNNFLQCRKGALRRQQSIQVGLAHVVQSPLRVEQRQQARLA